MELWKVGLILITGFCAGMVNVISAGGSLISLPVLIFLGLPSDVANGTNRVAIFFESVSATLSFRNQRVNAFPFAWYFGLVALGGALLGANLAISIDDDVFNKVLGAIMIMVVLQMIFAGSFRSATFDTPLRLGLGLFLMFFVGIYGGFIQAGTGFFIMAVLAGICKLNLVKANAMKAAIVIVYTVGALAVFAYTGKINWLYGSVLAVGNATGGWVAGALAVKKGEKLIKAVLAVSVCIMAVKLWFF